MPSLDQRFEQSVQVASASSLHPGLQRVYESMPDDIGQTAHMLFNGPPGVGKYTQALTAICRYSPTGLRYEKLMSVGDDKQPYVVRISDVHFEVDMGTLGCHSRALWGTIFSKIVDSVNARTPPFGFVLCKNFHLTHKELLEVFYYYMGCPSVRLILLADNIGFLPRRIVERCFRVAVPRPAATKLRASGLCISPVSNLKSRTLRQRLAETPHCAACRQLERFIAPGPDCVQLSYSELRTTLYDLLIRQYSIPMCVWSLIEGLADGGHIMAEQHKHVFEVVASFFRFYNNNYRPIYHLEWLCYSLRRVLSGKTAHMYILGRNVVSASEE
jgi:hypothetical protein